MDFEDVVVTLAMLYGGIERSSYQLIGGHSGNSSLANAIIWTDQILTQPTEQQVIDWEVQRLTEIAIQEQTMTSINNHITSNPITDSNVEIAYGLLNDLTVAYLQGLNPTTNTVYANFVSSLAGTDLETPITNYVTMLTGITAFGTGIPTADKQQIMRVVIGFLTTGLVVWIGKKI